MHEGGAPEVVVERGGPVGEGLGKSHVASAKAAPSAPWRR